MNWKPTNDPTNSRAPTLARTRGADRRMPRRTSGAAERRSMAVNTASSTTPPASVAAVYVHATSGRRTTPRTSRSIPAVRLIAPPTSKPPRRNAVARRRQEAQGDSEQPECEQHGREEHPAPVDRGEQATDDHAEREATGRCPAVDEQGAVACLTLGEVGRDDRQAGRGQEPGAHAGGEPGEDQHPSVIRQPTEAGEGDERDQRGQEHAPPAEEVGGAPAEEHEAAVAEHVGADDPLQRRRGQVQLGTDRRQGDAHHRHVEPFQEDGPAQDEEHGPRSPVEAIGTGRVCVGRTCGGRAWGHPPVTRRSSPPSGQLLLVSDLIVRNNCGQWKKALRRHPVTAVIPSSPAIRTSGTRERRRGAPDPRPHRRKVVTARDRPARRWSAPVHRCNG